MTDLMNWTAELAAVMPPPALEQRHPVPQPAEWTAVEEALGRAIPADYTAFMAEWGPGGIGDFIRLFAPNGAFPAVRMPDATLGPVRSYETLKAHHPQTFTMPVFPQDGGLMPFAVTDNGDYLGWIVGPGGPETWPVGIWGEDEGVAEVFPMSFGPFIVELVKGELRPQAFPEDLWDNLPLRFEPRAQSR